MASRAHSGSISRQQQRLLAEAGLAAALALVLAALWLGREPLRSAAARPVVAPPIQGELVPPTLQRPLPARPPRPRLLIIGDGADLPDVEPFVPEVDGWVPPLAPPPPMAGDAEPEIIDFYAAETPPELVGGAAALMRLARWPAVALQAGVPGVVQLRFVVGPDGSLSQIEVLGERPAGLGFADAAIAALLQARFTPGFQRERPVSVRMVQTLSFELR